MNILNENNHSSFNSSLKKNAQSFPHGIFTPGLSSRAKIILPPIPFIGLDDGERNILARLGKGKNTKSFSKYMTSIEESIIQKDLGLLEADYSEEREMLQRFFRRILVEADGVFDSQRGRFENAMAESGNSFLKALNSIWITRVGEPHFTMGHALEIFNKQIIDPKLYDESASALLQNSFKTFIEVAIKNMARQDSSHLNGSNTQKLKEVTNGLYAQVLFDIVYSPFIDRPNYFSTRDKYIASKLAFQYRDEVRDVSKDIKEGSANLLAAFARDFGETNISIKAADELPDGNLIYENTDLFMQYCSIIQATAPRAYFHILNRQRELIDIAQLPADFVQLIALPNTRNS